MPKLEIESACSSGRNKPPRLQAIAVWKNSSLIALSEAQKASSDQAESQVADQLRTGIHRVMGFLAQLVVWLNVVANGLSACWRPNRPAARLAFATLVAL